MGTKYDEAARVQRLKAWLDFVTGKIREYKRLEEQLTEQLEGEKK